MYSLCSVLHSKLLFQQFQGELVEYLVILSAVLFLIKSPVAFSVFQIHWTVLIASVTDFLAWPRIFLLYFLLSFLLIFFPRFLHIF